MTPRCAYCGNDRRDRDNSCPSCGASSVVSARTDDARLAAIAALAFIYLWT